MRLYVYKSICDEICLFNVYRPNNWIYIQLMFISRFSMSIKTTVRYYFLPGVEIICQYFTLHTNRQYMK